MSKPVRKALQAVVGTLVFALSSHLGGMYLFHKWIGSCAVYSVWWWILWLIDTPARLFFGLTGHGLRFEHVDLRLSFFITDVFVYALVIFLAWFVLWLSVFHGLARFRKHG